MWRQGDVFIRQVAAIPKKARGNPLPHVTLVHGEVTGHSHRLADPTGAVLYSSPEGLWLEIRIDGARIIHEEHGTIELPRGLYFVWRQREYSPEAIRVVMD